MLEKTRLELWLDRHNHTMELLRTLFGFIAAATGTVVFLKIFGFI